MDTARARRSIRLMACAVSVAGTLTACASWLSPTDHRLRVANIGADSINELVIRFPGSVVTFGNVLPGTTTTYRQVAGGVYGYGAFDFVVDSVIVRQPVIDWVGESPMEGEAFTYTLELITGPSGKPTIRLAAVGRDK